MRLHTVVLSLALGSHAAACASSVTESTCCAAPEHPPEDLPLVLPELEQCERAPEPHERVRLISWNMKAAREAGLEAVAEELAVLNADIVLLQEVDVGVKRTASVDQPRLLAEQLQHAYAFAPAIETEGGLYGIAILSRLPFKAVSRIPLSNIAAGEPRTALRVTLCVGEFELEVTNHHADWDRGASALSVREIVGSLSTKGEGVIFAGDFNQEPRASGPSACVRAGLVDVLAKFDSRPTYRSRRIDYIFADQATFLKVENARVVPTAASDHQLVLVDFKARHPEDVQSAGFLWRSLPITIDSATRPQ